MADTKEGLTEYTHKIEEAPLDRITTEEEQDNDARINAFTPEQQKKIIRRIDIRLVLTLGFMYCVSLMDRTNLGIAVVPPATVILRKVGPKIFLPAITIGWGIVMLCFGFLTKPGDDVPDFFIRWDQMVGLRVVLGIFEAGFFPGCAYLLSCWYPRYDLQKRNAVFYLIGSMASAFAGILAYGFSHMGGLGNLGPTFGQHYGPTEENQTLTPGILPGIAGWRWIFIMEGLLTIVAGGIGVFTIADFPEKAANKGTFALSFLNEQEAAFIVARIEKDRHDAIAEPFTLSHYLRCACDAKVWAFAWLFGLTTTVSYAIAYFLPIILNDGMGFSVAASQCLISPPYVAAAIWMYTCAYFGDKYRLRAPFIIFNAIVGIVGLALLGFTENNGARYFGVFLATISANSNIPCILTYQANNSEYWVDIPQGSNCSMLTPHPVRGQWKRALASATLVGAGGIGGIVGTTVFRQEDKPDYRPGMYATILASCLVVVISLLLSLKFHRANKRAAAGGKVIEGLEGFRYTL
ncbi:hypothetical protein D0859_13427 [Hortaea werneckii]|uniref:Major facilitator superfamily (MFS) profile domain-containing protein n=1 Tax=Hortaea werneckii TaxID=91943 RepID=A0A3M7IAZ5_HORWE|nr:hypothetical protein D0859_13427 [Hortaea werneckii]